MKCEHILITGAAGQLGQALTRLAPPSVSVSAKSREALDITDAESVARVVAQEKPDCIINAAAYTAVDKAEEEVELATAINEDGVAHLAMSAARHDAQFIHVSTDFVFDGTSNRPYSPDSPTAPLGVYGKTKLAGEVALRAHTPELGTIVRTSWVYGPGGSNFVRTMLRLLCEGRELRVVSDQIGCPTHTDGLAELIYALVGNEQARGRTLHWSDAGAASWFDVAEFTRLTALRRWPGRVKGSIQPTDTAGYPTAAERPKCSILDSSDTLALTGLGPKSWMQRLESSLANGLDTDWLPS